jgi:hypothetical protein
MRLDNGNIYLNGKATSYFLRKVNTNDVVKVSFDSLTKAVYFEINDKSTRKVVDWNVVGFSYPVRPAVATRAIGNQFHLLQGGSSGSSNSSHTTTPASISSSSLTPITWITTKNTSSSKAEVYTVQGNVVTKSTKDAYIYNIESTPSSGAFKFQIKVLEAKKTDAFNAIGVRDPKNDAHLRCQHGACVQLSTGKMYVT